MSEWDVGCYQCHLVSAIPTKFKYSPHRLHPVAHEHGFFRFRAQILKPDDWHGLVLLDFPGRGEAVTNDIRAHILPSKPNCVAAECDLRVVHKAISRHDVQAPGLARPRVSGNVDAFVQITLNPLFRDRVQALH